MHCCNCSVKKITLHEGMDGSSWSSKRSQYGKKMNSRSLLLSSNKMSHYFKQWTTRSCVLKKLYYLYKNLILQIDLRNSSCFQKLHFLKKRKLRPQALRKSNSLEKVIVPRVTLASVDLYNCSSKIFTILKE